jgi:hypothetical protein
MTKQKATCGVLALFTLIPVLGASASIPIPHCRKGDRTESGLSGETTAAERSSGAAEQGFNCNTDLVGQYQGEGASWQLTAWKNCAYFDQRHPGASGSAELKNPGVVVVDVSNPAQPKATAWLDAPAMIDPWESLKVNATRQLLAGGQRPLNAQSPGEGIAIYDIAQDCAHPVLKSAVNLPGSFGHTGQWAPDGNTYYITPIRASPSIVAVDTKDLNDVKVLPNGIWTLPSSVPISPRFHDLEFSKDGNTAYIAAFGASVTPDAPASRNGLLILDVSDFQQRRANPQYRAVGTVTWDDGSQGAQNALPVTIKGKPYILFTDEGGGGAAACSQGKSASGFPRLIDISDPTKPVTVAKIQLDVHDPAFCSQTSTAPIQQAGTAPAGPGFFGHSCHYCRVDDADNAKIAACNCFAAGLRIFDISDPTYVKEIAYFKPGAKGTQALAGSQYANSVNAGFKRSYDWASSIPSFPKDRGMTSGDIWTTAQDNGFMVVKLDPNATAGVGGGCASADATVAGLVVFGLMHLVRRRIRRSGR